MTERTLLLPGAGVATHSRAVPAAKVNTRAASGPKRPVHVAVAVGVTAGLYAVSLAGVTALQAGTDARLAANRAPAAAAVEALRDTHDDVEAEMARIEASYASEAGIYKEVAEAIGRHEKSLAVLDKRVAAVEGSTSSLRVPSFSGRGLPSVSTRTVYVARPATNACTNASGNPC